MNLRKEIIFIEALTPVLTEIASRWVQPGTHNEAGIEYGCSDCDRYSPHGHEKDCHIDLARQCVEEFARIDSDVSYLEYKGKIRDTDSFLEVTTSAKVRFAFKTIYKDVYRLIPVDFSDPINNRTGCLCLLGQKRDGTRRHTHASNCLYVNLTNCLKILL